MLELSDVMGGYGQKKVLQGVSLRVERSEIVGLVGPNGSGKSTVLKGIFGLVRIDGGTVCWDGADITNRPPARNTGNGICYIPQGSKTFTRLTVQENLELGGLFLRDRSQLARRIAAMYEQFPQIAHYRSTLTGRLSGGERQMVGFCRGLIMEPSLLLVDEPSIGLAPALIAQTMRTIRDIRDRFHVTILIVEQNVRAALGIVSRAYLLSVGRIIHEERTIDGGTEGRLRELFLK
jgi:branched-chain amino acid transport system ATP-binding protein